MSINKCRLCKSERNNPNDVYWDFFNCHDECYNKEIYSIDCVICENRHPNLLPEMGSIENNNYICGACLDSGDGHWLPGASLSPTWKKEKFNFNTNYNCPVCLENKLCIDLPDCSHKLCIQCFRNIYFGYNSHTIPEKPGVEPVCPKEMDDLDVLDSDGEFLENPVYNWITENIPRVGGIYGEYYVAEDISKFNLSNKPEMIINNPVIIEYIKQYIEYWACDGVHETYCHWFYEKRNNSKPECPQCREPTYNLSDVGPSADLGYY